MWLVIALILGFGLAALIAWMRSKGVKMAWYEWLIGIAGLLLVLFALQNFVEVRNEFNPGAANKFLMFVGLPGLVLMVIAWQLTARRQKKA
ncbi:dehalogenase [Dehalogenimonas sp. 4OHTPN]|uniref:Dehalogenase n=1 Tax=Dehalogenimonas sp. 4OHTPN TaxID=3166643 RepID=A0AAU8G9L3_9CHLR